MPMQISPSEMACPPQRFMKKTKAKIILSRTFCTEARLAKQGNGQRPTYVDNHSSTYEEIESPAGPLNSERR
jgi:hypothetical protein